ncbi:hypothetical protein SAMN05414139_10115 [Burkholderia sp. D7]|nr:hypothetical protein SAMN05414139_10115 [Burkholderia sp. D7]
MLGHFDLEGHVKADVADPMTDGQSIDRIRELTEALSIDGLDSSSTRGEATTFIGCDPISRACEQCLAAVS